MLGRIAFACVVTEKMEVDDLICRYREKSCLNTLSTHCVPKSL